MGHFYQGVLKGQPNSSAAFTIFKDGLIGMITFQGSNIVIMPDEKIQNKVEIPHALTRLF